MDTQDSHTSNSEISGLVLLLCTTLLLLSLCGYAFGAMSHNWFGLVGYVLGGFFCTMFGLVSFLWTGFFIWYGWRLVANRPIGNSPLKCGSILLIGSALGVLLNQLQSVYPAFSTHFPLGGTFYRYLSYDLPYANLHTILGGVGTFLVCCSTLLAGFLTLTDLRISSLFPKPETAAGLWRYVKLVLSSREPMQASASPRENMLAIRPETNLLERPSISAKVFADSAKVFTPSPVKTAPQAPKSKAKPPTKRDEALKAQRVYNGDFAEYQLPGVDLLTDPPVVDQGSLKKDLRRQAEVLEETLLSFGIEAKVGQINCGPSIISFEVHPAIGVKVQKIRSLEHDLALNMEARSIRIIAPIPGKAAVGIEIPNPRPQEVSFKDLMLAYQQGTRKFHIPVLLGKAVNGENVMSDLAKMPHCIIAGATGSGKSVCINTIIMSIVYNARPDEVKLIMVDPKKVELTPYTQLPHLLAPVITEPTGAFAALMWLVKEMEKRYEFLKLCGVRNIEGFNNRKRDVEFEKSLEREIPERLYYIVAIIDELADLMMVSSHDIETPIARIAQMARAVGIHLILATQRPSREVITGLIKANFPTRLAFKVSSRVNSQIILDEIGAEALLGNGDMLFLPPGTSHLTRAQGAYVRDEDIHRVVEFICNQAPPNYAIASFETYHPDDLPADDTPASKRSNDLYEQAKELVISSGNASTTFLQRKLKLGYARAAGLIDQLEDEGVISPPENSKPRQVLRQPNADVKKIEMDEVDDLEDFD